MQKNLIPMEWFIATLAALTIPLFVLANVPVWATYVTWAGAFLVGPNEAIRKLYPTLIVGTISGAIFFMLALTIDPIIGLVALPNSLIAFGDDARPALPCADSGVCAGSGDLFRLRLFRGSRARSAGE